MLSVPCHVTAMMLALSSCAPGAVKALNDTLNYTYEEIAKARAISIEFENVMGNGCFGTGAQARCFFSQSTRINTEPWHIGNVRQSSFDLRGAAWCCEMLMPAPGCPFGRSTVACSRDPAQRLEDGINIFGHLYKIDTQTGHGCADWVPVEFRNALPGSCFRIVDFERQTTTTTTADCSHGCNGNGFCDPSTGRCECQARFTGQRCDTVLATTTTTTTTTGDCSHGCSGNGICDSPTGNCTCPAHFTGQHCNACDTSLLPYEASDNALLNCRCYRTSPGTTQCASGHSSTGMEKLWGSNRCQGRNAHPCWTQNKWSETAPTCSYDHCTKSCWNCFLSTCCRDRCNNWRTCTAYSIQAVQCCLNDVDDCMASPCQQLCENVVGQWSGKNTPRSYQCGCHPEHVLEPDAHSCTDCRCEAGWYRPACVLPLPACEACEEGWYKDWNGVGPCQACEPCEPGFEKTGCGAAKGGLCMPCAPEHFKPDTGLWNARCTPCVPCAASTRGRPSLVACRLESAGACSSLSVQSPACDSFGCSTWWAGGTVRVAIAASAALCDDAEACGDLSVALLQRLPNGSYHFVGRVLPNSTAELAVTPSGVEWTFEFRLPSHTARGYSYFLNVSYNAPGGTVGDAFILSDMFAVRSNGDRLRTQHLEAVRLHNLGDITAALQLLEESCREVRGGVDQFQLLVRPALDPHAQIEGEASCIDAEVLRSNYDITGAVASTLPGVQLSVLQKSTSESLEALQDLIAEQRNNWMLRLLTNLQRQLSRGDQVTLKQLRESSELDLSTQSRLTLEQPLRAHRMEVALLEHEVADNMQEMESLREQGRLIRLQADQEMAFLEFRSSSWLRSADANIAAWTQELHVRVANWEADKQNAQAVAQTMKTISSVIKIGAGIGLVIAGQPWAGGALIADGVKTAVEPTPPTMEQDLSWNSDMTGTLSYAANKTGLTAWAKKAAQKYSGKSASNPDVDTATAVKGAVDLSIAVIGALQDPELATLDPELPGLIQQAQAKLAELKRIKSALVPFIAASSGVQAAVQSGDDYKADVLSGIASASYLPEVIVMAQAQPQGFFADAVMTAAGQTNGQSVELKARASTLERLLLASVRIMSAYRERSLVLLKQLWQIRTSLAAIAELELKLEEFRQDILGRPASDLASMADVQQLADVQRDSFAERTNLELSILRLLRKQELALQYTCLTAVKMESSDLSSYEALRQQHSKISLMEQRCLEEQDQQRSTRHPRTVSLLGSNLIGNLSRLASSRVVSVFLDVPTTPSMFDEKVINAEAYVVGETAPPTLVDTQISYWGPSIVVGKGGERLSFAVRPKSWWFRYTHESASRSCEPFGTWSNHETLSRASPYGLWQIEILGTWPLEDIIDVRLHFEVEGRFLNYVPLSDSDIHLAQHPGSDCVMPATSTSTTTSMSTTSTTSTATTTTTTTTGTATTTTSTTTTSTATATTSITSTASTSTTSTTSTATTTASTSTTNTTLTTSTTTNTRTILTTSTATTSASTSTTNTTVTTSTTTKTSITSTTSAIATSRNTSTGTNTTENYLNRNTPIGLRATIAKKNTSTTTQITPKVTMLLLLIGLISKKPPASP